MIFTAFLIAILVACLHIATLCISWRSKRSYAHLPHLQQFPVIGNLHKFFGDSRKCFLLLREITNKVKDACLPLILWIGPVPVIVLSDPDEIKVVANTFADKPYYFKFARIWLGDGLVTAPGKIWKKNVKKIASTFIGPVIDQYQSIFNSQSQKFIEKLKQEVDGDFFDPMPYSCFTTMEAICQAALGMSNVTENIVTSEYYRSFGRTLELLINRGLNIFLHPDLVYEFTPAYKELQKCVAVLQTVSKKAMTERKMERDERKGSEETKSTYRSFLDVLLDISKNDSSLTDKQILAEVDTIILAGQETVATTLCYTLLVIGSRKDVQENIMAEYLLPVVTQHLVAGPLYKVSALFYRINNIFGNTNRDVQKEDLLQLRYCEAVINESLRLYPPAPAVIRQADQDLKIKSCTITKGTIALFNIWGMARAEKYWGKDAAEFRPERWLPPNNPPANAHLPFSTGKRSCIGKRYAMAFIKTILVHVIRNYELISEDTFDQMEFKIDLALRPINGYLLKLKRRK